MYLFNVKDQLDVGYLFQIQDLVFYVYVRSWIHCKMDGKVLLLNGTFNEPMDKLFSHVKYGAIAAAIHHESGKGSAGIFFW